MKARLLKKLLNNTGYTVHDDDNCICIGSPMCSTIVTMDKKTYALKYAADAFNQGRAALNNDKLVFIWDKLRDLADSGEIKDIIDGDDELDVCLPVFTVDDGIVRETVTDCYGWPNVTISGELMYDNTWFKTREGAIAYGIEDMGYGIRATRESIERLEKELSERKTRLSDYEQRQNSLLRMQEVNS